MKLEDRIKANSRQDGRFFIGLVLGAPLSVLPIAVMATVADLFDTTDSSVGIILGSLIGVLAMWFVRKHFNFKGVAGAVITGAFIWLCFYAGVSILALIAVLAN